MTKGERIKKLRTEAKLSLEELANIIGSTKSTVFKYENDIITNIPSDKIEMLAKAFNVMPTYLMGWGDDTVTEQRMIFDNYFPMKFCSNLSAGTLDEIIYGDPDSIVYVPYKFFSKKDRLHAFKINGDSMNNVLKDGSIVITEDISHLSSLPDGTIVVAWVEGLVTIKRIYITEHQISLSPDSKDKTFSPMVFDKDNKEIRIIGKVIWHMNPDDIEKYY